MDLKQTKLTKSEWNNTEVSVGNEDKVILKVINDGYNDVNIKTNMNESLFQILKIEKIEENELYLFEKYFDKTIKDILKKYNVEIELDKKKKSIKKPKKVDILRIDNLDSNIQIKRGEIFEFILLDLCNDYLKYYKMKNKKYILPLFTLIRIHNMHILHKNKYVMEFVQKIINYGKLNSILTIMKGLPISYFKDLQDDKALVFDGFDTLKDTLIMSGELIKNIKQFPSKELFENTIQSLNLVENVFNYKKLKIKNNPGFPVTMEKNGHNLIFDINCLN